MTNVGAIAKESTYIKPLFQGIKNSLRTYANFVFGVEQSDVFSKSLRESVVGVKNPKYVKGVKNPEIPKYVEGKHFTNFQESVSKAWEKSKKVITNADGTPKKFGTVIKDSFKSMKGEFKAATRLAKATGKTSKFFGATMKILGKRLPLIGNVIMLAMEVPNIVKAFTDKKNGGGIGTGLTEVARTGVKLAAFAAGSALGLVFGPLGAIAGGIAAGWAADKLMGPSFTQKAEEKQVDAVSGAAPAFAGDKTTATKDGQTVTNPNAGTAMYPSSTNTFAYNNWMDQDIKAIESGMIKPNFSAIA